MPHTSRPDAPTAPRGGVSRAQHWLDARGKGAWIAAIVLGFIAFWPLGLGLLLYVTLIRKQRRVRARDGLPELRRLRYRGAHSLPAPPPAATGDEQARFEPFRAGLRSEAGDEDFDAFLERRAARSASPAAASALPEAPEPAPEERPAPPPAPFSTAGPRVLDEPTPRRPSPARR